LSSSYKKLVITRSLSLVSQVDPPGRRRGRVEGGRKKEERERERSPYFTYNILLFRRKVY
jgi:hypothetical protein